MSSYAMAAVSQPAIALSLALLGATLVAQDTGTVDPASGTIDPRADYSGELPRIAPRSVEDSARAFTTLEGFRVEAVAAEPLIADPVAVSFDGSGRAWVVCMQGYSEQADENLGEVRVLEDNDGNGRYDHATVFLDGLSWPTGIHCWAGGAFVAVAPDVLYCKDTDGDGRADVRDVVLTGFGRSNVQGLLNSLRWGLDNRIHGATSSSAGSVTATANGERFELRGRDFALDPRTGSLEYR